MSFKLILKQSLKTITKNKKYFMYIFVFLLFIFSLILGMIGFLSNLKLASITPLVDHLPEYSLKKEKFKIYQNFENTSDEMDIDSFYLSKEFTDELLTTWNHDLKEVYSEFHNDFLPTSISDPKYELFSKVMNFFENNLFKLMSNKNYFEYLNLNQKKEIIEFMKLYSKFGGWVVAAEILKNFTNNDGYKYDTYFNFGTAHFKEELTDKNNLWMLPSGLENALMYNNKKRLIPEEEQKDYVEIFIQEKNFYQDESVLGKVNNIILFENKSTRVEVKTKIVGTTYSSYDVFDKKDRYFLISDNDEVIDYLLSLIIKNDASLSKEYTLDSFNEIKNSVSGQTFLFGFETDGYKKFDEKKLLNNFFEKYLDDFNEVFDEETIFKNHSLKEEYNKNNVYKDMFMAPVSDYYWIGAKVYDIIKIVLIFLIFLVFILAVMILKYIVSDFIDNNKETLYFLKNLGETNARITILNTIVILPIILISLALSVLGMFWIKNVIWETVSSTYLAHVTTWYVDESFYYSIIVLSVLSVLIFIALNSLIFIRGTLTQNKVQKLKYSEKALNLFNPVLRKISKRSVTGWSFISKNITKYFSNSLYLSLTFGGIYFGVQFTESINYMARAPKIYNDPYLNDSSTNKNLFNEEFILSFFNKKSNDFPETMWDKYFLESRFALKNENETRNKNKEVQFNIAKNNSGEYDIEIILDYNLLLNSAWGMYLSNENFNHIINQREIIEAINDKSVFNITIRDKLNPGSILIEYKIENNSDGPLMIKEWLQKILTISDMAKRQYPNYTSTRITSYDLYEDELTENQIAYSEIDSFTINARGVTSGWKNYNTSLKMFDNSSYWSNKFSDLNSEIGFEKVTKNFDELDWFDIALISNQKIDFLDEDEVTFLHPYINSLASSTMGINTGTYFAKHFYNKKTNGYKLLETNKNHYYDFKVSNEQIDINNYFKNEIYETDSKDLNDIKKIIKYYYPKIVFDHLSLSYSSNNILTINNNEEVSNNIYKNLDDPIKINFKFTDDCVDCEKIYKHSQFSNINGKKIYMPVLTKVVDLSKSNSYRNSILTNQEAYKEYSNYMIDQLKEFLVNEQDLIYKITFNPNATVEKIKTPQNLMNLFKFYFSLNRTIFNKDIENSMDKIKNAVYSSDELPFFIKEFTLNTDKVKFESIIGSLAQAQIPFNMNYNVMDFNKYEEEMLKKMSTYVSVVDNVTILLVMLSIFLSLLLMNIILKENKKNILLFKSIGYKKREINLYLSVGYFISAIAAAGIGFVISYYGLYFISDVLYRETNTHFVFEFSPKYISTFVIFPTLFALSIFISVGLYTRVLNPKDAFSVL